MHRFDTFTDLRVNSGDRQGEITLWPSFTDIMTVVLMIFMLTMIVVIIKNTTLAQALLTSENQKKQVQSLLHDKEKAQAELKSDIKGLQAGVAAAREEAAAFEKKLTELARQYEVRIAEIQAASEKRLAALSSDKAREIEDYNRKVLALLNQLHQQLGALRQKWQDQLYVKVIIPEDSGLTYNEAWTFTKDILSRYDYYFQEKTGAPAEEPHVGHTGPAEPSQ